MGRCPVGFECSVVAILLVNEETALVGAMTMNDVHHAPGFFARIGFELAENLRDFLFMAFFGHPCNGEDSHGVCLLRTRIVNQAERCFGVSDSRSQSPSWPVIISQTMR